MFIQFNHFGPSSIAGIGRLLFLLLLLPSLLHAQFPEGSIFTKSLEEAKKDPEKVVELDLSGQNLTTFPPEILKMKNLAFLGLSQNKIQEIPAEIGELKKLYKLGLVGCQLKTLPSSIGDLTELVYLHLEKNDLDALPESLGNLHKLKRLTLSENKLKKVPDSIGELDQLEWLLLGDNQLSSLPESIGKLSNLQVLLVSLNQLEALPESIGELGNLEQFSCVGNRLKTLPEAFGSLHSLRKLKLSDNLTLSDLPASMEQLIKLESIQMGNCAFTQFPIAICQLPQLKVLFANKNQIGTLPNEIKGLKNLETMNLSGNPLEKDLNEGIYELKKLKTLMLAGNGFTNEEVAVIREKLPLCHIWQ